MRKARIAALDKAWNVLVAAKPDILAGVAKAHHWDVSDLDMLLDRSKHARFDKNGRKYQKTLVGVTILFRSTPVIAMSHRRAMQYAAQAK